MPPAAVLKLSVCPLQERVVGVAADLEFVEIASECWIATFVMPQLPF